MAKIKSNGTIASEWTGDILRLQIGSIGVIQFDRTKASAACRDEAERLGWQQRLSNRAAMSAPERKPGMSEDAWVTMLREHKQTQFDRIQDLAEHYESGTGEWTLRADGPGSLLIQSFMRVKNATRDQARRFLESRTKEQLATIKKDPRMIAAEAAIRLERAGTEATSALDDWEEFEMDAEIAGDAASEAESGPANF